MGVFTVVGYLLYRFSQTLPALIRWPIRLFCSLTGLSALWGWVSRLVGTLRGIQSLFKWLSRIWRLIVAFSSKFKWLGAITGTISGSSRDPNLSSCSSTMNQGLRLIILGPAGGERTSMANTLLGCSAAQTVGPLTESTMRRTLGDSQEIKVIDTPDLLDPSVGNEMRAREALRSLQLASPGPHALLLVIQVSGSSTENIDQDATYSIQAILELFGNGVSGYIIPVLTHADYPPQKYIVEQLLTGGLKTVTSLCGQRPQLVNNRPDQSLEVQSMTRRELLGRVMEVNAMRGHFVHELQRREDHFREKLLSDMASSLAGRLGHTQ
ncbi:uncharacterized protein ACBR49_017880 isoform 2-T4 [Aulostomus maculatus]